MSNWTEALTAMTDIPFNEQAAIDFGRACNVIYQQAGKENDPGQAAYFGACFQYDVCAGMSVAAASVKHLARCRQANPAQTLNPPPDSRPFPGERGRLSIDGIRFINQGSVWAHRGASFFTLPARLRAGQDISPQKRWMARHGVNTGRFFLNWTTPSGGGGVHANDRAFDDPAYSGILHDLALSLAEDGLRAQFTVVTENGVPLDYWRRALQITYDVAAQHENVTVELENEPWMRDTDIHALMAGIERHGVLSSTGVLAQPAVPDGYAPMDRRDYLDFGTHRTARDDSFPKNGKNLEDLRSTTPIPWNDDEPMGIMDVPNRGGRTNDKTAVLSHSAISMMYGGLTIHTQAGIDGLTPEQTDEPLTEDICTGLTQLWQFFPPDVQLGSYVNTGRDGGTGIVYRPNDSLVNRSYGSLLGDTLWVVVPVPREGWQAETQPGWRIAETGPVPYVLRLERT